MRKTIKFGVALLLLATCIPVITYAKEIQKIAVYVAESTDEALTTILGDQLVAAFVGHDGYIAIERTTVFLNELQKEQEYQRSGQVDDYQISKLGKQFGVQLVCVAKATSAMGQNYISARMVDVESANISATAHKAATLNDLEDVVNVCSFVACQLLKRKDCQQYERALASKNDVGKVEVMSLATESMSEDADEYEEETVELTINTEQELQFIYSNIEMLKQHYNGKDHAQYTWECGYPALSDITATFEKGILTIEGKGRINSSLMQDNTFYKNNPNVKQPGIKSSLVTASLKAIIISDGITVIDGFRDCSKLEYIVLPATTETISENAFRNCKSLDKVVLPEGVQKIGKNAFENCESVTTLFIPNTVTEIGAGAFSGMRKLSAIRLPASLEKINDNTFKNCRNLIEVNIPKATEVIGNNVFQGCTSLSVIKLRKGITNIGEGAFRGAALSAIKLPNTINRVGRDAFKGCKQLTEVKLPEGLTAIEQGTFEGCSILAEFVVPKSVVSIGERAFRGCGRLYSVTILGEIGSIGKECFDECKNLVLLKITNKIPPSISESIVELKDKHAEDSYKRIVICVPAASVMLYKKARYWKKFGNITGY